MKKIVFLILTLFTIKFSYSQDTKYLQEESDWLTSQSEAETECWNLIDYEMSYCTSDIESQGGTVVGVSYVSPTFQEIEQDGVTLFKCVCESEIDYLLEVENPISRNLTEVNIDQKVIKIVEERLRINKNCPPGFSGNPRIIEISNLEIFNVQPIEAKEETSQVPSEKKVKRFVQVNCTDNPITKDYTFTDEVKTGYQFTNTSQLKSKSTLKSSVNVKLLSVTGNVTRDFTQEMNFTKQEMFNNSKLERIVETQKTKVFPKKKQIALSSIETFVTKYKYKGTIVIDGTVIVEFLRDRGTNICTGLITCPRNADRHCSYLQTRKVPLSSILNEKDRTIKVNGTLFSYSYGNYVYKFSDQDVIPADCEF